MAKASENKLVNKCKKNLNFNKAFRSSSCKRHSSFKTHTPRHIFQS